MASPLSSKERLGNRGALPPVKYRDHITVLEESNEKPSRNNTMTNGRCFKPRYDRHKSMLRRSHKEALMSGKQNGCKFIGGKVCCAANKRLRSDESLCYCHLQEKRNSCFRQIQMDRRLDDNLNANHVVPNGYSEPIYRNDTNYDSVLDDKENNFLNLESDPEEEDLLNVNMCDFGIKAAALDSHSFDNFDLSLDSDTEIESEETLQLECDDSDADDLFLSLQEECFENEGDQLVCQTSDISSLPVIIVPSSNQVKELYIDLPSHDDLSSATVEVLALSHEVTSNCDVKDVVTTSGIIAIDQLCSDSVSTVCFTSSDIVDTKSMDNTEATPSVILTDNVDIKTDKSSDGYGDSFVGEISPTSVLPQKVENKSEFLVQEAHKTGQTHEEVFMEALEIYKKSGAQDTNLEKFENRNFTIQHESLHPSCQPSILKSTTKNGRYSKKFKNFRRDYRRNLWPAKEQELVGVNIKDIRSVDDIPSSIVTLCQRATKANRGSGDTALHKACRNGRSDMALYYVLEGSIDINTMDYAGWTALHEACSRGCYEIARLLVKHGANIDITSHDGTRPIHDAIEGNSLDIVRLLVESGADVSIEREGKTLIDLAEESGTKDILEYLGEHYNSSHFMREKLDVQLQLAVDASILDFSAGYNLEKFSLGEELDSPLFYIVPIIELSEAPMLPLFNISVPNKDSLRRHNFYLLGDILTLGFSKSEILHSMNGLKLFTLTVADFIDQISLSDISTVPVAIQCLPPAHEVQLVPQCLSVQRLLNFITENMDD